MTDNTKKIELGEQSVPFELVANQCATEKWECGLVINKHTHKTNNSAF